MNCPHCGHENIQGVDDCEACGQPLEFLSMPRPSSAVERSLVKDRIQLLGPRPPKSVSPGTTVREAMRVLSQQRIGCVLVMEGHELKGIFSERDALMRLNVDAAKLAGRPVSEFMTPNPETLDVNDKIAF